MRKYFKALFVVAVATVAGYNAYKSQSVMNGMSEMALANVEALAGEEWDGDNQCHMDTTFWECLKYVEGVYCYCGL